MCLLTVPASCLKVKKKTRHTDSCTLITKHIIQTHSLDVSISLKLLISYAGASLCVTYPLTP